MTPPPGIPTMKSWLVLPGTLVTANGPTARFIRLLLTAKKFVSFGGKTLLMAPLVPTTKLLLVDTDVWACAGRATATRQSRTKMANFLILNRWSQTTEQPEHLGRNRW